MSTKKSAKKTTSRRAAQAAPQAETPDLELAPPETVTRYELLGCCEFLLVDPGERLPSEARQALFNAQKGKSVICVMQCEGYVFNFVGLPFVAFIGRDGNVTASSGPAPEGEQPAKS